MLKTLGLDYYSDGYDELYFNCFDIPLAVACGKFSREYYFFYLFNMAASYNWGRKDGKSFKDRKNAAITNMGLELKYNYINRTAFIEFIKQKIDKGHPLLIPVRYRYIFFAGDYRQSDTHHLFLVNGYNPETGIIQIRESPNVISCNALNNNIGLYPFNITEELLVNIWKESNISFYDEYNGFYNTIYTVEKVNESGISNYNELIDDFLCNYDTNKSLFINGLDKFRQISGEINYVELFENIKHLRKWCQLYFNILLDIICRYIARLDIAPELYDEFYNFRQEYIKSRSLLISKIHSNIIKRKPIYPDEVYLQINEMDNRFAELLNKVRSLSCKSDRNAQSL